MPYHITHTGMRMAVKPRSAHAAGIPPKQPPHQPASSPPTRPRRKPQDAPTRANMGFRIAPGGPGGGPKTAQHDVCMTQEGSAPFPPLTLIGLRPGYVVMYVIGGTADFL